MTNQLDIELPVAADAKSPQQTWRILFLDNADHIAQLKDTCKKMGYAVVGSTSIQDAWTFLNGKDHVDVIVCAAHLEEESVFKFLKEVRDHDKHSKVAFLILSLESGSMGAQVDRSTARTGMALGASGYLVMPQFDASQLITQIQKLQPDIPMLQQSATVEEKQSAE